MNAENPNERMNRRSLLTRLMLLLVALTAGLQAQADEPRFYVYNATNGLADNSAQTIYCTKTGRLVITTMGQINFFDGNNFTYIDPSRENTYHLSNYTGNYHLYFDRFHHLWLKDTHSVTCVNLTTERFVDSVDDVLEEFGCQDKVTDLFVDQTNIPWLLTAKGLYNVETKQTYPVQGGKNLQDMELCGERYLLLFYDTGLTEVTDLDSGKKIYSGQPYGDAEAKTYSSSSVVRPVGNTVYQIRNGQNTGILMRFDIERQAWKTILKTPYYLSNIAEKDSVLYVPSAYGYFTYDLHTEELTHYRELTMATGQKLLTDINMMAFDKQGGLWVGTEKRGLLYARPYATPFKVYGWESRRALDLASMMESQPESQTTFRGRKSNCVYQDSRGWIWVGTSTGLHLYKSEADNLPTVYTKADGLLNNVIHTIIEDDAHNIWVGTSYGISCLVFKDNKMRYMNSYSQWDNIPAESFVNGKAMRLADGSIAMQMLDHVIEFNPARMKTINKSVNYEIYPKLVRVMVNGNNLHQGEKLDGKVILEKAIPRTSEINLSYYQNSVTLTFSALNYFRPQQTYYRVRIGGLDDTWRVMTTSNSGGKVDSRGNLHLPMPALQPGTYTVEVQTSMIPDEWDSEPYAWIINVNEPWWRTAGVMVLYGLLLLALLGVNAYYFMKNLGMRTKRNLQEQGIVRQVLNFAEHCGKEDAVLLEPVPDEYGVDEQAIHQNDLTPEFIAMMEKIIPKVIKKNSEKMTMRDLSAAAEMELQPFYQLVLGNIFKSHRPLAKSMMLKKAVKMLTMTEKDLEQIAKECGFVSTNYFIGIFYHQYRMTPEIYRRQHSNLRRRN